MFIVMSHVRNILLQNIFVVLIVKCQILAVNHTGCSLDVVEIQTKIYLRITKCNYIFFHF